jgi:hypothetical protein
MGWKTAANTNIYIKEEELDGSLPVDPVIQSHRYVTCGLEGSYETIASDTKFPGRNPSKNYKGTDSNAGDLAVNFASDEYDYLLAAVLCSEKGFVKIDGLSTPEYDVFEMVPGNKQRAFILLRELTQDPKLYQLFRGIQVNTLGISFTIGALIKLTFGLMGSNNPLLEETAPFSLANRILPLDTDEIMTTIGSWKVKGPDDAQPEEYIDGVDISLNFSNNMTNLLGLFQKEAIDKSLNMLDISGNINEYVKDGKLYNYAKRGADCELTITVRSPKDDIEYIFILKISFDNSTLSGDSQLQYALPFKTYGENRFVLRKKAPAKSVTDPDPTPDPDPNPGTDPGTTQDIDVTGVSLDQHTLELEEGDAEQLGAEVEPFDATNKEVVWSSSNDGIATVNQDGIVEAIAAGNAVISVTTDDGGFTDTCAVEVK